MELNSFVQKSLMRPVNSGYIENDPQNFVRFNYGLQKYIFKYIELNPELNVNPRIITTKHFRYTLPYLFVGPLVFSAVSVMNRRVGATAAFAGIITHCISIAWSNTKTNRAFQEFIFTNYKNFDEEVKDALQTGDARYLKNYIDYTKPLEELEKTVKAHLCIL